MEIIRLTSTSSLSGTASMQPRDAQSEEMDKRLGFMFHRVSHLDIVLWKRNALHVTLAVLHGKQIQCSISDADMLSHVSHDSDHSNTADRCGGSSCPFLLCLICVLVENGRRARRRAGHRLGLGVLQCVCMCVCERVCVCVCK